jgi:steroid delta-isomerase-like uncharacterized protein
MPSHRCAPRVGLDPGLKEEDMAEALETARRYDEAFNAEARAANQTPDIEVVLPGGITLHGSQEVAAVVGSFWEALPDCKITAENEVTAEGTVVTEGTLSGTHTGVFRTPQGEIPASGNRVELRYASVKQVRDGKVAHENLYFDQLEFLQQLGAAPPPT